MNFKVTVTKDFIDAASMTPAKSTLPYEVSFKGKPFEANEGTVNYPRTLDYFITMLNGASGQHIYETHDAESGESTVWLSILRNAQTELFFEVFKKAGMYMSKLSCGYNVNTNTIVVSGKLFRELSRASEMVRLNIATYLRTLLHMAEWFTSQEITYNTGEGYAAVLDLNITSTDALNAMYPLEPEATWEVSNECSETFSSITYYSNAASTVGGGRLVSQVKYAVLDTKNHLVATWTVASAMYAALLTEKDIYTNCALYSTDLATESVITELATYYCNTVRVHACEQLNTLIASLNAGVEEEEVDENTLVESDTWAMKYLKAALFHGNSLLERFEHGILKEFGLKIDTVPMAVDKEAMKAQYAEDSYAQELYAQHKQHYDEFNLNNLEPNLVGFSNGDIYSMVFVGESGTGKSTAARVIPDRCGIPYISVNFSVNIEEADLFGAMYPNPYKKSADDPEFVWQDGIITKAVRNGYCVILEELNFARPGVLGKLNSLLDENRQVDLSNGEIVRAHPNFRIIATCNIAYEGTNRFNKALINRFDDVTEFVDLARGDAIEMVMARTSYKNRSKINKVYEVYEAVKKFAKEQNITCVVSMRQLLNIFSKGRYYKDARDAVSRIMLNGAFLEDIEYLETFKETVLPAFDLNFKI